MPDLTLAQLKHAYDAALEQIAAESFLEKGMPNDVTLTRLQAGNNPVGVVFNAPDLPGKLRMALGQAQDFEARYKSSMLIKTMPRASRPWRCAIGRFPTAWSWPCGAPRSTMTVRVMLPPIFRSSRVGLPSTRFFPHKTS